VKVLIAEDQRLLRGALAALLNLEEDIEVVAEAEHGGQVIPLLQLHKPDLCIMDIEMPVLSGLDVAEQIKKQKFHCKVVILTTFARPGYLQRALRAGVHAYLLKDTPVNELADALRRVNRGERVISPELAISAWDEENPLNEREQQLLKFIANGATTSEIAHKMFITEATVRNYISEILHKLEAKNRMEAVRIAREKGWISE
jgi:two-component system response regulator DesR